MDRPTVSVLLSDNVISYVLVVDIKVYYMYSWTFFCYQQYGTLSLIVIVFNIILSGFLLTIPLIILLPKCLLKSIQM